MLQQQEEQEHPHQYYNKFYHIFPKIVIWLLGAIYYCATLTLTLDVWNAQDVETPIECSNDNIFTWLTVGASVHFIFALMLLCPIALMCDCYATRDLNCCLISTCVCIMIIPSCVGIWTIALGYNISSNCADNLRSNYPIFWEPIVGFAISDAISVVALLFSLMSLVISKREKPINCICCCYKQSQSSKQALILNHISNDSSILNSDQDVNLRQEFQPIEIEIISTNANTN